MKKRINKLMDFMERKNVSPMEAVCLGIGALGTVIIVIEAVVAAILRS